MKNTQKVSIDKKSIQDSSTTNIVQPDQERDQMIATAAYFRAEKRGFTPNDDQADWFESENEINELINLSKTRVA